MPGDLRSPETVNMSMAKEARFEHTIETEAIETTPAAKEDDA